MANKKLTDLTELTTPADNDFLYIVDVSDTTESAQGTSKKIRKDKVDSGASKENIANKQNSLAIDGTGTKYPTVDAVNTGLETKQNTSGWVVNSQIFNTSSPSVITTGTSFAYSGSGLVVSGGDGTYNNHSNLTNYTLLEDYQIELGAFVNTVDGAGIGIGIDCLFNEFAICKVDLSVGANRGKIYITRDKSTFSYVSSSGLSFSNTDLLQITLRRSKFSVYIYFKNITTGAQVSASFNLTSTALLEISGTNINRIGTPAIWAFGGTQTFLNSSSIVYKSYSDKSPKLAIIGTSIDSGYAPATIENRWANLNGEAKFTSVLMASASATTTDIINTLPELVKIKPEYASFSVGVNDSSLDYSIVTANFRTINNYCIANNIKTIWCLITPKTDVTQNANITALNAFITGTLINEGISKIIDFNTLLTAGGVLNPIYSVDGIHINASGNTAMAQYYIANTKDLFLYDDQRSIIKIGTSNASSINPVITTSLQGQYSSGLNKFNIGNNAYFNNLGIVTKNNPTYGAVQDVYTTGSISNNNSRVSNFLNLSGTSIPISSSILSTDGQSVDNTMYGVNVFVGKSGSQSSFEVRNGNSSGSLSIGADVNAITRTNGVRKLARFTTPSFSDITKNHLIFSADFEDAIDSKIYFGGSPTASILGCTEINFVTVSSVGLTGGSTRMQVKPSGAVTINTITDDGIANNKLQVNGNVKATQFRISALNTAPASATDTGTLGEVRITATHIYVCTATNTWVRTALATW